MARKQAARCVQGWSVSEAAARSPEQLYMRLRKRRLSATGMWLLVPPPQPPVLSPLWITVPRNWLFNSRTTFSRGSHQLVSLPTAMVPLCKTRQQLWSTTTYFTIDTLLWYRKHCNRKCVNYSREIRSNCQILEWAGAILWVFCLFDAY